MGACTLDYSWGAYIVASLISLFGGLAILIPIRIMWCACHQRGKNLMSVHQKTQSRLTRLRSLSDHVFSGNSIASKTAVIIFWLFDVAAFAIYVTEAALFDPEDKDNCGSIHEPLQAVWICLMAIRFIRFVITFVGAHDKFLMWIDIDNLVDHFLIIPTVVGIHFNRNWLGLRFLTVVHLLKTPLILQMIHVLKNRNGIHIVNTIVITATVWLLGAGMILILENNGDPFPADTAYTNSRDKGLKFGEAIYFIFITLTTIGYGDVYPVTVLGRIFTVVFVLLCLALFTSMIPELGKALASRNMYHKSYKRSYGKCHIVICGNPTFETLSTVVRNFLHEDAAVKKTDLVIIEKDKPTTELLAFFRRRFNDVTFIQGTVLHIPTLKMAKVESADAVFILANRDTENQDEEDKANIMRATAVKNLASNVRIIIQLHQHQNKEQILTIPSWRWNNEGGDEEGDEVVCVSELKMSFMAQNCLAPGIVTMFSNLISMRSFKPSNNHGTTWMDSYGYGAGHEIYVETFSPDFAGVTFAGAATLCYTQFEVLLLAIEREERKGRRNALYVNPGNDFVLRENDVGFFIAQGPHEVQRVARYKKEKLSRQNLATASERELLALSSGEVRHLAATASLCESDELLEFVGSDGMKSRAEQDGIVVNQRDEDGKTVNINPKNSINQEILDQTGLRHWGPRRQIEDATLDEESIKELDLHDHVVFLLQPDYEARDGTRQRVGLVNFVGPLRTSSLRLTELRAIVFYADLPSIQKEWASISNFPQVYFYQRNDSLHSDLRFLNVHRASMCLVMSTAEMGKIDNTMVDKSTILTTMNILSFRKLEEKVNQLGVLANPELFRKQISLISDVPMLVHLEFDDSVAYIYDDDDDDPSMPLYQTTPYACGRVILSSVLDSMVTMAYLSSKIHRLVQTLISGSEATNEFERLMLDGVGLVRRKTLIDVSTARKRSSLALLGLSHGPLEKFHNFTSYGQLVTGALRSCGILCLGLYRLLDATSKDPKYQKRFVITNPQYNFGLLPSDKVYVLKPFEFDETNCA